MRIADFDFELPDELIAQEALANRAASRMLCVERRSGTFRDAMFADFPALLNRGDTLVVNNTKVFPARLFGESETGAKIEIFLVKKNDDDVWETLARPARRLKTGKKINFGAKLSAEVVEKNEEGRVFVTFQCDGDFDAVLDELGKTPLPPYIKRADENDFDKDRARYQTVYARQKGSIAAPTAGLHFTPEVLHDIASRGVTIAEVTLHVGYGTFEPVRVDELSEHRVSPENYELSDETADALNRAKTDKTRIIAVGTTTTRTLETIAAKHEKFISGKGLADLTITPGFRFRAIDGILTNFHLPQSSLLVLVSTFGGHEPIMIAYRHAVQAKYRFYSYGDCMFVV